LVGIVALQRKTGGCKGSLSHQLCCRAWVLQERALATRTIHFSKQLFPNASRNPTRIFLSSPSLVALTVRPLRPKYPPSGVLLSARLPSASRVTLNQNVQKVRSLLSGATPCALTPPATFLTSRTSSSPSPVWRHAPTWPSTATTLSGFWRRISRLSYCGTPYHVRLGAMRRNKLDTKMSVWNPIQRLLLFLLATQEFCISSLASRLIIAVSEFPDSLVKSSA